ncbi:MAG: asparagine synthase (glutamine-hydrolyzing) [Gammaproteobacteria bacterium]|nr:asparagine synthase (glutamine-hydrolyzing) [Gammaproteobacteria bacterium]
MCSIAGAFQLKRLHIAHLEEKLHILNKLQAHRGPDDNGIWLHQNQHIGLAHSRLSIIDLSQHALQPMHAPSGEVIVFNGEIYNYLELKRSLSDFWDFKTQSDTEVILAAYKKYGNDCLQYLQGMFAFAIWDGEALFCARDRFGIKPFYYTIQQDTFIFASEAKALIPFLPEIKTKRSAFVEYMTFQNMTREETLFEGVFQLEPAKAIQVSKQRIHSWQYWDVHYQIHDHQDPEYFSEKLTQLLDESIALHCRADVKIGAYVSGGIDSSLVGILATKCKKNVPFFHGRFLEGKAYDESEYANSVAEICNTNLHISDITAKQFTDNIHQIIYHLDFPIAGPGAFPQYIVSQLASQSVKVMLGGQGGDEIFGGYARYLIGYFDQCIKAGIEGAYTSDVFSMPVESIVSNMQVLQDYKPLMQSFWRQGLFEPLANRYFSLVNRLNNLENEVSITIEERHSIFQYYLERFDSNKFKNPDSYLDAMMHFDLKCLLPGLLHVEDRVSMAHGIESRVPLLHHPLIEFMAQVPPKVKFANGQLKYLLKHTFKNILPSKIINRKDKMGFPVPLQEWVNGVLRDFIFDNLNKADSRHDNFINYKNVIKNIEENRKFTREHWGFLCFELWQQVFHDKAKNFQGLISKKEAILVVS